MKISLAYLAEMAPPGIRLSVSFSFLSPLLTDYKLTWRCKPIIISGIEVNRVIFFCLLFFPLLFLLLLFFFFEAKSSCGYNGAVSFSLCQREQMFWFLSFFLYFFFVGSIVAFCKRKNARTPAGRFNWNLSSKTKAENDRIDALSSFPLRR